MSTIKIRRFRPGDEVSLFEVFYSAIHLIALEDYNSEQIDAWAPADLDPQRWAIRMRKIRPFVAEEDRQIVGYADLQPNGYIDHFFVSGHHVRHGIGSLLMQHIHDEAQVLGIQTLSSDVSKNAQAFFEKHGFHVVEIKFPISRGVKFQNALMHKVLMHH
ncbi:GNAT family N-acetyltransferase [Pseudomonas putida]|uniref:GNAT family N-acetyltransferase n=1 Tax=Pseudomonas putida TaxID=303 RepID=A0AAW5HSD4_PSEPU|nr:GNAT family N-acetyltransferase [Pseudomonas putida]MCO1624124.1 GNAT family N-acetyltransferase [Pseudomonas putida]